MKTYYVTEIPYPLFMERKEGTVHILKYYVPFDKYHDFRKYVTNADYKLFQYFAALNSSQGKKSIYFEPEVIRFKRVY